ncbi:MAG: hypothetical protein ACSLFN_09285 [Candidatus Limnocylindrales bacterium]
MAATSRRRLRLDIDASAGRLLAIAGLVVVGGFLAVVLTDWLRTNRVDTWAGPDAAVQSGLRLDGCPAVSFQEDVYFPSWVRFEGKVFSWTDSGSPIGPNSLGSAYVPSGYTLGDLQLFRVTNSLEGREGRQIMLRQGTSPVGANYVVADCG